MGHTDVMDAQRAAVIGAGVMGAGVAPVLAQGGHPVARVDVSADARTCGRRDLETEFYDYSTHP